MKKIYLLLILLMSVSSLAFAVPNFSNETLNYVIQYKWGLVQKDAGKATLRLSVTPQYYDVRLTAKTLPWADKFYQVRDTLTSRINRADFKPISYRKATHEDGKYRLDALSYSFVGQHAYGKCVRTKSVPGKPVKRLTINSSATGPTYDMLSIFYYIRALDYDRMLKGSVAKATIFSGSAPETLTIRCKGKETVKLPSGKNYACYKMEFTFTTDGRKKSSAPMIAWISADAQHIPVKLEGSLPVGKVRVFLS